MLHISGPETCNSVNMLRLTEALFMQQPDATKAAYYERTLFNHILSAYDPVKGMCRGIIVFMLHVIALSGAVDIQGWKVRRSWVSLFIAIK